MRWLGLILFILCSTCLLAQDDSSSLADAAKKAHEGKAKSKVVISDENFVPARGPLPDLNIEGLDNSDEVLKAIHEYRKTHTPVETEQVVHDWYDRYDVQFQNALDQNTSIRTRAQDRSAEPAEYPNDYRKYQEQRTTEMRSVLQDQRTMQKNNLLVARIQQSFQKIRNGLQVANLRYDWMKIRFGNGNGSW